MPHCLLCSQQPAKNTALIFLDIDGVLLKDFMEDDSFILRIHSTVERLFPKEERNFTMLEWQIAIARHFPSGPLDNLQKLVEKIQSVRAVQIVLSSAWRNRATLEEICEKVFSTHFFSELIIGKTPPSDFDYYAPEIKNGHRFGSIAEKKYGLSLESRAEQIDFWLREHNLQEADFVIFDDLDDGLSKKFGDRFIQIDSTNLLSEEDTKVACEMLRLRENDT